jgi:hypothetical protein
MPPDTQAAPLATGPPDARSPAEDTDVYRVIEAIASRPRQRASAGRKASLVFVSLYEPIGRRRWWWYSYRCPVCRAYQLGRAASLESVAGARRAGCGHRIAVNIARVYGQPGAAA